MQNGGGAAEGSSNRPSGKSTAWWSRAVAARAARARSKAAKAKKATTRRVPCVQQYTRHTGVSEYVITRAGGFDVCVRALSWRPS